FFFHECNVSSLSKYSCALLISVFLLYEVDKAEHFRFFFSFFFFRA
ncbi:unnamed protein product, partial [Prunus brigantina]